MKNNIIQHSEHICTQLCEKFNEFPSSISAVAYERELYFHTGISFYYFNRNIKKEIEKYEIGKFFFHISCFTFHHFQHSARHSTSFVHHSKVWSSAITRWRFYYSTSLASNPDFSTRYFSPLVWLYWRRRERDARIKYWKGRETSPRFIFTDLKI